MNSTPFPIFGAAMGAVFTTKIIGAAASSVADSGLIVAVLGLLGAVLIGIVGPILSDRIAKRRWKKEDTTDTTIQDGLKIIETRLINLEFRMEQGEAINKGQESEIVTLREKVAVLRATNALSRNVLSTSDKEELKDNRERDAELGDNPESENEDTQNG